MKETLNEHEHVFERNHVISEYVVWTCIKCEEAGLSPPDIASELERFSDLDDEGWKWLRNYYEEEKKDSESEEIS